MRQSWRGPPDLAWIEPGWAFGSRPGVHLPNRDEAPAWADLGVEFCVFPTEDWVAIPTERFARVVDVLLDARRQGRTILLHCVAGVNRAPTFAAAALCVREGMGVDEAVARVRAARPIATPTPEQLASLHTWLAGRRRR
jgi:protein-tyrosine phosphatase